MGLKALADNIISAYFPDKNEEIFDTNEFLGLNEDTAPYMGLNFQAKQA